MNCDRNTDVARTWPFLCLLLLTAHPLIGTAQEDPTTSLGVPVEQIFKSVYTTAETARALGLSDTLADPQFDKRSDSQLPTDAKEPEATFESPPLGEINPEFQLLLNRLKQNAALEDEDDPADVEAAREEVAEGLSKRDKLAARGISIEPVYFGEVFTNARGGKSTRGATQYEALLDLGLTFDFEKMLLPLPGRFFLLAQNTHGRGLSTDFVGDVQILSNIDSFRNITQVNEYWWEFQFLDDAVTLRLGKQDINTEFLFMRVAADFINSTFGLSPSTAFPTYPDPAMAAVALVRINESMQLKLGVWDALPEGFDWGFTGNGTFVVIAEFEYTYALRDGTLPGKLDLGFLHESPGDIAGDPFSATQQYYIQLQQLVYAEQPYEDEEQGLAIFGGYYPRNVGPQLLEEAFGDSFVVGMIYTGLLPRRDDDVVGIGVAYAELFQGGTNQEVTYELFYRAQITERIVLQPDLQYITTPAGIERDALVVGTRFVVTW